jgi:hypothetical protein
MGVSIPFYDLFTPSNELHNHHCISPIHGVSTEVGYL